MTMHSELKIHGRSPRTSKCPIFHQQCAFKLSISLYGTYNGRLSSRFETRVTNFQQFLLSGNPELLWDLRETALSNLLGSSKGSSCPTAWSERVHLFSTVPVWTRLLLEDPVPSFQPETKPGRRPVSPHLTPNCNKLFSSHSQAVQKHSSQDTSVADYKLLYYIHLLPLDVLRQTLNVDVWGRECVCEGGGFGGGTHNLSAFRHRVGD